MALTDFDFETEQRMLGTHTSDLDENERVALSALLDRRARAIKTIVNAIRAKELPVAGSTRAEAALRLLEEITTARAELVSHVVRSIEAAEKSRPGGASRKRARPKIKRRPQTDQARPD
jgi:hypothetical protein